MKDQSSQGKTPGSPYLKKSHRKIKTTSTMFFDWEGIVHHQYTPPGRTMNKKYYFSVLHWLRDAIDETATVMGNWWLAASSWQCTHSFIMSRAEFLAKYQIIQVTQPLYSLDLVPCDFWLFPKLKSPLKGKRFQTINEIQENMMRQVVPTKDFAECFQ